MGPFPVRHLAKWLISQKLGAHTAQNVTNIKNSKLHNIRNHKNQSLPKVEDVTTVSNKVLVVNLSPFSGKRLKLQRSWYCGLSARPAKPETKFQSREQNIS